MEMQYNKIENMDKLLVSAISSTENSSKQSSGIKIKLISFKSDDNAFNNRKHIKYKSNKPN